MKRLRRRRRLFVALCAALLTAAPVAAQGIEAPPSAAAVADLTVVAYGAQRLDLATGRTVLEDGGEVVDRRSGLRLTAAWIAYAEGVDLVARDVQLVGDLGSVAAAEVTIDLVAGRVWALGGVAWSRDGLDVRGEALWFDVFEAVAGLHGGVLAETPAASAAEAWVDLVRGRVLLLGPYRYADGPLTLAGDADGVLQLDPSGEGETAGFDATTDADPAWRARVEDLRAAAGLDAG